REGFGGRDLHAQPGREPVLVREETRHLGPRVARDHEGPPRRGAGADLTRRAENERGRALLPPPGPRRWSPHHGRLRPEAGGGRTGSSTWTSACGEWPS